MANETKAEIGTGAKTGHGIGVETVEVGVGTRVIVNVGMTIIGTLRRAGDAAAAEAEVVVRVEKGMIGGVVEAAATGSVVAAASVAVAAPAANAKNATVRKMTKKLAMTKRRNRPRKNQRLLSSYPMAKRRYLLPRENADLHQRREVYDDHFPTLPVENLAKRRGADRRARKMTLPPLPLPPPLPAKDLATIPTTTRPTPTPPPSLLRKLNPRRTKADPIRPRDAFRKLWWR